MNKFLLASPKNLMFESVFWNVVSNGLNSVISFVLLLSVTRINGAEDAGIFSLGFSTAQMMLTIGNYGMRNYQATDVTDRYSQSIYSASRIITSIIMIVIACLFVNIYGYTGKKASVILGLCILKASDAMDDVFGGYYQRMNRLDISGKILFLRIIGYVGTFVLLLLFTHDMFKAILSAVVVSTILLIWMVYIVNVILKIEKPQFAWLKIKDLLIECFPLCVGAFLLVYMGNAPKYAIDNYLSIEMQAYYNYLFMPCFVINLLVSFSLQPLLVKLSMLWKTDKLNEFRKYMLIIYGCTVMIALFVILVGSGCGCSLLSLFFGIDVTSYQNVLQVLLIGGGLFALAVVTQTVLTIMRHQYSIFIGFIISSIVITIISPVLVKTQGLEGAAYAYTISSGILGIMLVACVIHFYKNARKNIV